MAEYMWKTAYIRQAYRIVRFSSDSLILPYPLTTSSSDRKITVLHSRILNLQCGVLDAEILFH